MNTNYSKIALLLALGAIAGDKVGADIRVNHVDGVQFNSDLRKSVVKGQFLDVLNKIHDTSKSKKLSEYLDRIQATIVSKNNVAVRSSDFIKGDDFKLTPEGRVVFGVDEGVFAPLLKDQKAKKELELDIKDDFKKLSEDIDHIVEQSKGTTAFDSSKLKVIKIDNSLKKDIEDFVARSSKSRISELFKGGVFVKDKLENIQYRTLHSDNIARLLSKEQNKLSQKINQLVGDISVA